MPLPFILGAAALALAGYGAKKGVDAYKDTKEAEDLHDRAQSRYRRAERELKEEQEGAQRAFESLGALQERIVNTSLERFKEIVDKLKISNDTSWQDILSKESLQHLVSVRNAIVDLGTALSSVMGSATAGAMAGFGAWGLAGLVGSASTGTALSALGGAAATNATLAWFGGGSLAAGGLGMAGGAWVLGGIVAAPVIAVAASVFASKAEERKYNAQSYYSSVRAVCECMQAEGLTWQNIACKAQEKEYSLGNLDTAFQGVLDIVEGCMQAKGLDADAWSKEEKLQVQTLMQQAETITIAISAPLMHDEEPLTQELQKHQQECKALMENIQARWG
ncbi:hypothetical protein NHP21005_08830 [Helicobacter sp. NHP21005]|uniref:hypothetical protein n=1 Tax=Helicobacter felistomachi TaxID=3040201 RepID=UPI00257339F8|nr:hypothetical protein [Helicobacter sp. NHP21005]BEG57195.1 hypothetical protein NHP21005_08830 [Helicobacter sp. NHP21005]